MITQEEYVTRQSRLLAKCLPNSILIIRSASELTRSRDTEFPFRQDSDFFYLTGFNEPDSWLILSNRNDTDAPFRAMSVRPTDRHAEIWHGRRLGVDRAQESFMLDMCFSNDDLPEALLTLVDGHEHVYLSLGHHPQSDELVPDVVAQLKASRTAVAPTAFIDWQPIVHEMRLFKSCAEIAIMKQAAKISVEAHKRAMTASQPGKFEYQLAADMHHTFASQGALAPAYNTIVGSGENACILHYTENRDAMKDGDLVLIDAGAELDGYASDITRTFPINGTFSKAQKALYELVLQSQESALSLLVAGNTINDANEEVVEILTTGLVELGILSGEVNQLIADKAYRRFYMHGLGHWLGLDVHDVGDYKSQGKDRPLQPGMVLTVEPGLYIPDEEDIPDEYRGIGIRIEDNIVITANGNDIITEDAPKTIAAIESLMQGSE
ncbi:Xaa-Pro aminopeptidase [Alteromonas sediminis]|uniref:Xaa-Pro aminopeptidase n=1 Tax=Alteromonas sediminis TaxID=2259342 RepID=A0A3N5YE95_9ALTE|nr:Xaa-Pro aminopeptidase [Alteromonas sediminis]RPJ67985.1 Xaa-Pro aminopeptidase [Alteromonas sediminis]